MSILNVRVAPPVRKTEIYNHHAAKAAMQKEWDRLLAKYVWDEEHPREWHEVCDAARRGGVGGGGGVGILFTWDTFDCACRICSTLDIDCIDVCIRQ